jgi:hypothetical protein
VMQVNYDFHGPVDADRADAIIADYANGTRTLRGVSGGRLDDVPAEGR